MSRLLSSDIESRIVQLFKQKDKESIALIYDNYARALYGIILRIVKTSENAEEVLQDVLVKVWKKSDSYDSSKGKLFTWLLNISRNTAIDYTRSAKFKADQNTNELDLSVFNNSSKMSESSNTKDIGLQKVIGSLDDKYRKVIDLIYFQGYTQREVEKELGIPLGTVKSRLRIALRELRGILGSESGLLLFIICTELLKSMN